MSVWKYKQLMPKILVNMLRLIEPDEILDLVGKPSEYIYSALARTSYQAEFTRMQSKSIDYASLERLLLENFTRMCRDLMKYAPRNVRALIGNILAKFEACNVKAVLRAKAAGTGPEEAMKFVIPVDERDQARWADMFGKSQAIADVIWHLSEMSYGPALEHALREYQKTGRLLPLEVAMDRYAYGMIWKGVGRLGGLDGRIARTILGLEIDSVNVRTILRCKEMRMDQDQVMGFLFPLSDVFRETDLKEAVMIADVVPALERLVSRARLNLAQDYEYVLADLVRDYQAHKSISHLDTVFDRGLLTASLRMLKRYTQFFNIGSVLALLNLKWFEMRNLRAVIRGAEEEISPSLVRELLILPA